MATLRPMPWGLQTLGIVHGARAVAGIPTDWPGIDADAAVADSDALGVIEAQDPVDGHYSWPPLRVPPTAMAPPTLRAKKSGLSFRMVQVGRKRLKKVASWAVIFISYTGVAMMYPSAL